MLARQPSALRWVLVTILLAALAANACRFGPGGLSNPPTSTASPAPATAAVSVTLPGRTAVLNDLVGNVVSGPAGGGKDVPASDGQVLSEGAQVRTGKAAKATVNLNDGTILRLRPDTLVTLNSLAGNLTNPFTRLLLALGKVFVILKSGQLEVQSAAGLATVTGSFLSVEYQADTNTVTVTCLEGNCSLRNAHSGTALTTGQAASLAGGAGAAPVLRWMTRAEIQAWLADNPEAQAVAPAALTALPPVTGTQTQTPLATGTPTPTATPTGTRTARPTARPSPVPSDTATRKPRQTSTPPPPPLVTPSPTSVPGQPLVYTFDNICDPAQAASPGTYHVTLAGQQSTAFDVAPGKSVQGSLPPGDYVISWQLVGGPLVQMNYSSSTGPFSHSFCAS